MNIMQHRTAIPGMWKTDKVNSVIALVYCLNVQTSAWGKGSITLGKPDGLPELWRWSWEFGEVREPGIFRQSVSEGSPAQRELLGTIGSPP